MSICSLLIKCGFIFIFLFSLVFTVSAVSDDVGLSVESNAFSIVVTSDVTTDRYTDDEARSAINNSGFYNITVASALNGGGSNYTDADARAAVNNSGFYNVSVSSSNILKDTGTYFVGLFLDLIIDLLKADIDQAAINISQVNNNLNTSLDQEISDRKLNDESFVNITGDQTENQFIQINFSFSNSSLGVVGNANGFVIRNLNDSSAGVIVLQNDVGNTVGFFATGSNFTPEQGLENDLGFQCTGGDCLYVVRDPTSSHKFQLQNSTGGISDAFIIESDGTAIFKGDIRVDSQRLFLDEELEHWIFIDASELFNGGGLSNETFWLHHNETHEEGTLAYLLSVGTNMSNMVIVQTNQVGQNNSGGIWGNSLFIMNNRMCQFDGFNNGTHCDMDNVTNVFRLYEFWNVSPFLNADTATDGASFIVQGKVDIWNGMRVLNGFLGFGKFSHIGIGGTADFLNTSLHPQQVVNFTTGFDIGQIRNALNVPFIGSITPFVNLDVSPEVWFITSSALCADDTCSTAVGSSGSVDITMETNFSTLDVNETLLNFSYALAGLVGANNFRVEVNNFTGSGWVEIFSDSGTDAVTVVSLGVGDGFDSDYWNGSNIGLRFICDVTQALRTCYVDNVDVSGVSTANTSAVVTGIRSQYCGGTGIIDPSTGLCDRAIYYNPETDQWEATGNTNFTGGVGGGSGISGTANRIALITGSGVTAGNSNLNQINNRIQSDVSINVTGGVNASDFWDDGFNLLDLINELTFNATNSNNSLNANLTANEINNTAQQFLIDQNIADILVGDNGSRWNGTPSAVYSLGRNVGIGTNTPQKTFHVDGDVEINPTNFVLVNSTFGHARLKISRGNFNTDSGVLLADRGLTFWNFGIDGGTRDFSITDLFPRQQRMGIADINSGPTITQIYLGADLMTGINTREPKTTLYVNGTFGFTELGSASATVLCWDGQNVTSCSSSERYKENMQNYYGTGWEDYMKLTPISFNFKDKEKNLIGLSAEEVNKIDTRFTFNLTRPIYDWRDIEYPTEEGGTIIIRTKVKIGEENKIEGIDYNAIIAVNLQMIQELYVMNQELQDRVVELESMLNITYTPPKDVPEYYCEYTNITQACPGDISGGKGTRCYDEDDFWWYEGDYCQTGWVIA